MPLFIPGGVQSVVEGLSLAVGERQFVGLFDNTTHEFIGFKVGKIYPGQTGTTPYADVPTCYVLTDAEKARLAALMTNSGLVDQINAELGTDLANILNASGLDYSSIATILDTGPSGDRWRHAAVSIYGNPADGIGDLEIADGALAIATTSGLQAALDGKSGTGHGHETAAIVGLDAALAAKIATSRVGVDIAELEDVGGNKYLKSTQIPPSVGNTITSVFTRTGDVVAASGDYTATQITNTPAGTIAATTVQAALNELDTEKVATSAVGAASGVCPLNSSSKIDSTYFPTSAVSLTWTTTHMWSTVNVTFTDLASAQQEWGANTTRRVAIDTTFATKVYLEATVNTVGATGSMMRVQYSTDNSSWTVVSGADFTIDSSTGTGFRVGAKATVPGGAIGTLIYWRITVGGGDAAADPVLSCVSMCFDYVAALGPGTMTSAQIQAVLDADIGTTWKAPAGTLADGSVTLAKIVSFATQTAPLRKSAGTGVLEAGTQSDWRTFLGVANTVFGRTGTVVATSGDYTADQITETATRAFLTPTDLLAFRRMVRTTTVTTSQIIGFNEAWVIFGGAGTLVLTGTLTNGAVANFISIYNSRTVAVNLVPQSGRTMSAADGTALTTYSLAAKASLCAQLSGTVWVLQV